MQKVESVIHDVPQSIRLLELYKATLYSGLKHWSIHPIHHHKKSVDLGSGLVDVDLWNRYHDEIAVLTIDGEKR